MPCTYFFISFQAEIYISEDSATTSENADTDVECAPKTSSGSHFPTKNEWDDFIGDLSLTKSGAK